MTNPTNPITISVLTAAAERIEAAATGNPADRERAADLYMVLRRHFDDSTGVEWMTAVMRVIKAFEKVLDANEKPVTPLVVLR